MLDSTADRARLLHEQLEFIVGCAILAPSVHNTQPWRFRVSGDTLEVHADLRRHLPETDPDSRQLHISCGAAAFGARLAMRVLARAVDVILLPEPSAPTLLARLQLGQPAAQTDEDARLAAALPRRHTVRCGFHRTPIDDELRMRLQHVARREGVRLHLLEHPGHRRAVAAWVTAAEMELRALPGVQRELHDWTPAATDGRLDGVPAWAYSHRCGWKEPDALTVRDFDLGRRQGQLHEELASAPPALTAVLLTPDDTPRSWLRAGLALQAALLTAAAEGVQASLHSQPIGLQGLRSLIGDELSQDDLSQAQMLLHFGHARTLAGTPRRPTADVIDP